MISERRSGRIAREIRIVLMGTDTSGRVFSEETRTVVLSRHGAGVLSKFRVALDEILTMRFLGGTTEVAVRLVGELGHDSRGYTYGVAFVDPELDFWELKFPPPPRWQGGVNFALECALCQTRDIVDQTEVEADVYALCGYILRFCSRCGTSTEWRRAATRATAQPVTTSELTTASAPQALPATGVPAPLPSPTAHVLASRSSPPSSEPAADHQYELVDAAPETEPANFYSNAAPELTDASASYARLTSVQVAIPESTPREALSPAAVALIACTANRRRDVRIRVSFTACVRQENFDDDIVECDNISKGGLSFRSRKSYPVGSSINVAAPYSPGVPAIFVIVCIRHVETIASGSLFRYGAAYARKIVGDPKQQHGR